MQTFLVGGAVRDALLSLPVRERDFMVVGANPEQMLAQGFKPVGRDFPVFLHPKTHEEYALARTERKTAKGHQGFTFHADETVTLEADLSRRDLTINAMAQDESGQLIDPFHGQADLQNRILRHVSPAFSEDPLRILRAARLRAYLGRFDFQIAPETLHLMQDMVMQNAIAELSDERIWQEILKALDTDYPELFFKTLQEINLLSVLFPQLSAAGMAALIRAKTLTTDPVIRYAAVAHEGPYLRVSPKAFAELRDLVEKYFPAGLIFPQLTPTLQLDLFKNLDFLRREERLHQWVKACLAIAAHFPESALNHALKRLKQIDRRSIALAYRNPKEIQAKIYTTELNALLSESR